MTRQDLWLLIRKFFVSVGLYLLPLLFVWVALQLLKVFYHA
ncbi:hypothetical protein [Chitinophaga nivalis]|uniref:1-acyl-sn-glycerol-3-phosphate acyltransferase n=1 Tax=Chitinophaga nivalis TaxID=2991709 RepID=A0ABT3IEC6_9BACT|nr:hypothetical protein [Chitinophaga nivalis]MCW3468000.1 hypothetical protein [Chitinophaga nivalis]MCW3482309.1 hypothetical protein [Chitinophaga nivalis]